MKARPDNSSYFPSRYVTLEDYKSFRPVHAVWEVTLACDLKCQHCGSRAGKRRDHELSTEECLSLIAQMSELGVRHVTLIGGEAYLRPDWVTIIHAIRDAGMECSLQTGAFHLTEERVRQAAEAGLQAAGVSIDGLGDLHDRLRAVKGSFAAAVSGLQRLREHGIVTSVNTQITSLVVPQLREMMEFFLKLGARHWQVQLTVPMGRAADHPDLLLQPYDLLELMPLLAELYKEGVARGLLLQPGNNIGYFGPYESLWRGSGDEQVHWTGCSAGRNGLGIEADGTIKGCPSLPTSPYAAGSVRDMPLKDIWNKSPQLNLTRAATVGELWGYCRTCYYADVCRAGCTWTTQVLFGRPGNNPYCHHRALEWAKQGLRERLVHVSSAQGVPFDYGRFELVLESITTPSSAQSRQSPSEFATILALGPQVRENPVSQRGAGLVQIQLAKSTNRHQRDEVPALLTICRNCNRHIAPDTTICPHCRRRIKVSGAVHNKRLERAIRASRRVLDVIRAS